MAVLAWPLFARGMSWLKENRRSWQPAALASVLVRLGWAASWGEMIRLHSYQYSPLQSHRGATVDGAVADYRLHAGLLGPRGLKQASDEACALKRWTNGRKFRPARAQVERSRYGLSPQRPSPGRARPPTSPSAGLAMPPIFADLWMTLGEFYCKGLTVEPGAVSKLLMVGMVMMGGESSAPDVVLLALLRYRGGGSISSLLAIRRPELNDSILQQHNCHRRQIVACLRTGRTAGIGLNSTVSLERNHHVTRTEPRLKGSAFRE